MPFSQSGIGRLLKCAMEPLPPIRSYTHYYVSFQVCFVLALIGYTHECTQSHPFFSIFIHTVVMICTIIGSFQQGGGNQLIYYEFLNYCDAFVVAKKCDRVMMTIIKLLFCYFLHELNRIFLNIIRIKSSL